VKTWAITARYQAWNFLESPFHFGHSALSVVVFDNFENVLVNRFNIWDWTSWDALEVFVVVLGMLPNTGFVETKGTWAGDDRPEAFDKNWEVDKVQRMD
jgi:hypothetical protein